MRAAVTEHAGGRLAVIDMPDPKPGPGELLVRVTACGICGSDLHLSEVLDIPGLVLGHEICATVAELGQGVNDWKVGARIAGFPLVGCDECDACQIGATSKCSQAAQLGLARAGGFAEYTTLSASSAFRIPAAIDDHIGALVEPLAVAHHALDCTRRGTDEPILVIGAGPVGAAVALWARALGAREVVVSDPVARRRELAECVGATLTVDPNTEDVASAFAKQCGALPNVVIECVGTRGMIQHSMDVAAVDAQVTVVGVCIGSDEIMPLVGLQKELLAKFVLYYRKSDFTATIAALANGVLNPQAMVTGTTTFDDLPDRFEALKHPVDDCKVILEP
ncbi:MAG: alcohol dehydrogenase [Acidimicrobiia bacterium]|nr:alcohol dehydrogenase [Acidimicrobiia bacterium]